MEKYKNKQDVISLYYEIVDEVLDEDIKKLIMYLQDYVYNGSMQCFESEEDW